MAILGRDLAPRRKPRRHGRRVLAVAVVLAVAAAVYFVSTRLGGSGSPAAKPRPAPCRVTGSPSPEPAAAAAAVTVRVLNGTLRPRLARRVAVLLQRRGFRVRGVGNAPRLVGRTTIRYGAGQQPAARALAEQLGSVVLSTAGGTLVQLDLGQDFAGLVTERQAAAARARDAAAAAAPARHGCTGEPSVSR